jgi:class 3 adenylate cyclase/tetratricopeptide (TPR) repeat protein
MRCPKCNSESTSGRKFCPECGSALTNRCAKCGADNLPTAKFCEDCGAALNAPSSATTKKRDEASTRVQEAAAPDNLEGERKTVTALFADIMGSTELEQDLDPEEARAIVDPALKLMIDAVRRYDGYVVQSTGDGIFAMFGAPVAHEDHPQRALYAALRMQEELKRYSAKLREAGNLPIEARVGVNSGEVVVRSITTGQGHTEYTPIGHTTNLASRMQALAPTGSIAISEQTRKFVEGYFQLKPLGPTRVKGISEPLNVYEVTGPGPLRTHFQVSARRGLTRFVGREPEMEAIARAAQLAKSGHGQIVGVVAEPGVGKSRLFYEFKARNQSDWMVLEAYSVSHGKASAYLPLVDLIHSYFRIEPDDDARIRREKVTGRVLALDRTLEDTLPYLLGLLGIVEDEDSLVQMDARIRQRRILEAIKRILLRESLNQPLMLVFEDLHWIDDDTQAFLDLLTESIGGSSVLLLVNYRPEYRHDWGNQASYTQLRLEPLKRESADEMLSALLGDHEEVAPLKRLIIEKTEGTPFFIEETIQALFEDGTLVRNGQTRITQPLSQLRIPATVQGMLASRIDRLPAAQKQLLQTLAVIGTEFSLKLASQVASKPEEEVISMLSHLEQREFIYERMAAGDIEYTFKHALSHDVAYNSVLVERRKVLHESVGDAIESLYRDNLDDHLGELARQYTHSGNALKTVQYALAAAEHAMRRGAHTESIAYLSGALQSLKAQPPGAERDRQKLKLLVALWEPLAGLEGFAGPRVEETLTRAKELCSSVGDDTQSFRLLYGLALLHLLKSEWDIALQVAQQQLGVASRAHDPVLEVGGHGMVGMLSIFLGQFISAREHLDKAFTIFSGLSPSAAQKVEVWHLKNVVTVNLWYLGYPDQARQLSREVMASARLQPPLVYNNLLSWVAGLRFYLRDWQHLLEVAEEYVASGVRYGFTYTLSEGIGLRGAALVGLGRTEEGLAEISRSIEAMKRTGANRPEFFEIQADSCARAGRVTDGFAALHRAERLCNTGLGSDFLRIKGELLLAQETPDDPAAERCFREAVELARRQSAKSLELRAAICLARLLAKQGKRDEARAMLSETYNWFTEGFDTADLKDAKALLDELSA